MLLAKAANGTCSMELEMEITKNLILKRLEKEMIIHFVESQHNPTPEFPPSKNDSIFVLNNIMSN